ncbi:expressed unknown protein [Seminavis robusta]|uniref:DUF4116 domain-containing protein n=1 Tax=Seminavis robusta TaxID=568900 RepID=A0A9N8H3J4_9STRA|nr:expressed unknown protein [Seminavis robusta]|eukprot:Sro40_g024810.1 n/a (642) ;mRNA; r:104238-106404
MWPYQRTPVQSLQKAAEFVFVDDPSRNEESGCLNDKEVVLAAVTQTPLALKYAADDLRDDKAVVLAAVTPPESFSINRSNYAFYGSSYALSHTSERLRNDKQIVLEAVKNDYFALKHTSHNLQSDKQVVLTAVSNHGDALQFAHESMKNDPEVVWKATKGEGEKLESDGSYKCSFEFAGAEIRDDRAFVLQMVARNPRALLFCSKRLQDDKAIVMASVTKYGWALEYASLRLQADRDVVMAAMVKFGSNALQFAAEPMKEDKDFLIQGLSENGVALKYVAAQLLGDKDVVLAAVQNYGHALLHANNNLQADHGVALAAVQSAGGALRFVSLDLVSSSKGRDIVMAALTQDGKSLEYAPANYKDDKQVVSVAAAQSGEALQHASLRLQGDKTIVLSPVRQNGKCLNGASAQLRADKDCVLAAISNQPESLKFALGGLNQDRDCLVMAGIWDEQKTKTADPSTEEALVKTERQTAATTPTATQFTLLLKEHSYIQDGGFMVYSPNAFNKGTCDPEWTEFDWPCRGTFETCSKDPSLKTGVPIESECCWRYSFRYHLEEAERSHGFMIQVVELNPVGYHCILTPELGKGQSIEKDMAQEVGIQIFVAEQPISPRDFEEPGQFTREDIERLVDEIREWYETWSPT